MHNCICLSGGCFRVSRQYRAFEIMFWSYAEISIESHQIIGASYSSSSWGSVRQHTNSHSFNLCLNLSNPHFDSLLVNLCQQIKLRSKVVRIFPFSELAVNLNQFIFPGKMRNSSRNKQNQSQIVSSVNE